MSEMFKKYLLASTALFAPPGDPPAQGDDQAGSDDDQIEFQDEQDEQDDPGDGAEEGDEQDDEDNRGEAGTDGTGGEQPPARQSRGERQYGDLRRQNRERAEENARLTRELAEMRGRMDALQTQQRAPQETAQQRAERLALLSPEERAMEMVNETLQRHDQNTRQLNAQLLDQADRSDFNMRCVSSPLFKKFENAVEKRRNDMLQREGNAPPRWVIATYLVGERVLEQQTQRGGRPANQRRRQQEARPVRSGGDISAPRQRRGATPGSVEDFEARFGDVQI